MADRAKPSRGQLAPIKEGVQSPSPDDVSPTSEPSEPSQASKGKQRQLESEDYFSRTLSDDARARIVAFLPAKTGQSSNEGEQADQGEQDDGKSDGSSGSNSTVTSPALASPPEKLTLPFGPIPGDDSERRPSAGSRKSSTASVSFRSPSNPSLPQGQQRRTDGRRLRDASPHPVR